jgi:hypothetical protein
MKHSIQGLGFHPSFLKTSNLTGFNVLGKKGLPEIGVQICTELMLQICRCSKFPNG